MTQVLHVGVNFCDGLARTLKQAKEDLTSYIRVSPAHRRHTRKRNSYEEYVLLTCLCARLYFNKKKR
jgi:hypothetical protein